MPNQASPKDPAVAVTSSASSLPFDSERLDRLMEASGIDVLLVTSKHNLQYMLDGYRFFFFDYSDAIGISRYLPILIYPAGRPEKAVYIGNAMENSEHENGCFWCPTVDTTAWTVDAAVAVAVKHLRGLDVPKRYLGVEMAFIPANAADVLRDALPDSELCEAHFPLERLRACKTAQELDFVREASERVVASMLAVFDQTRPGLTKRQLAQMLRAEELKRDLVFEYCLINAGTSFNRAPNDQVVHEGDLVALDSGGRYRGYIGDLCRMGIAGRPDAELVDLLGEVDLVQQAARKPIRAGASGSEIFAVADAVLGRSAHHGYLHFVAHGMGIIGHEAPRLTDRGPVTYPGVDAELPLEPGMVLSVETTMLHPRRGMVKLEDTLLVTSDGFEAVGDDGRGWNLPRG